MTIYTVTDDILNSEQAQGYFERAHPRALKCHGKVATSRWQRMVLD